MKMSIGLRFIFLSLLFFPIRLFATADLVLPPTEEFLKLYGYASGRNLSFTDFSAATESMAHYPRIVQFSASLENDPKSIDSEEELLIAHLLIQDSGFYKGFTHFSEITNIYAHPDTVLYHILYLLQVIKRQNPKQAKVLELHQYHFIRDYHLSVQKATIYWYQKSMFYLRHYASAYPNLTPEDKAILKNYLLDKISKDRVLYHFETLIRQASKTGNTEEKDQFLKLIVDDFGELKSYAVKMDIFGYAFTKVGDSGQIYPEKLVGIQPENEETLRLFWDGTGEFKTLTESENEMSELN